MRHGHVYYSTTDSETALSALHALNSLCAKQCAAVRRHGLTIVIMFVRLLYDGAMEPLEATRSRRAALPRLRR